MHKVILDTNVILSGILYGGTPAILLDGIQKQKFILCTSQQLFDEIFDKLVNKFHVDEDIIHDVSTLLSYGVIHLPTQSVRLPQDQKDAYLLELAEESKADYLVTGDKKHLIPLKVWKGTKIISPIEAKNIILTKRNR